MSKMSAGATSTAQVESIEFTLNRERVRVERLPATTTLLDWLRQSGRTGSKCGCAEGDCGACTVALVERDAAGQTTYRAFNSCIALLPMFAGREIVTVEGVANPGGLEKGGDGHEGGDLHPVQRAMVEHHGSQCGYCTPGFVVSMFEGYYRPGLKEGCQINDQLCGNLCRCTGYGPIRDAMVAALAQRDKGVGPAVAAAPLQNDPFTRRLLEPVAPLDGLNYAGHGERFFRPTSLEELFALKNRHADARLVAGATEIGVELNKQFKKFPALISVEGVRELNRITATDAEWRIGAAATLTAIEEALAGEFPSFARMLEGFASRQIRNRATLGGNLVTASPIGDSAPVLLTLDATVVLSKSAETAVLSRHYFPGAKRHKEPAGNAFSPGARCSSVSSCLARRHAQIPTR